VVNPDFGSGLNSNGVASRGEDLGNLEVPNDDVGDVDDTETNTVES
jgi:hypothetical protein